MRTITLSIPESTGVTANLIDEATGQEVGEVIRLELDDILPLSQWAGTIHFTERSGLEPEDVILKTA